MSRLDALTLLGMLAAVIVALFLSGGPKSGT